MAGTPEGAEKVAAQRLGLTVEEYRRHLRRGEKWCTGCKRWHPREDFAADRSRSDGLVASCRSYANGKGRAAYIPSPGVTPGRRFTAARDEDKKQAQRRVNHLVDMGILPRPNSVACSECGHKGRDRRHEYHHHLGYAAEHHEHVVVLCTPCHHRRERENG